MLRKAALVIVALSLIASASPIVDEQNGVRIALRQRESLTRADGTFDHEKAILHNIKTFNKYQRALRNLQRNTGSLPEDFEVKPFKEFPAGVQKRATGSVPLDDVNEVEWIGSTDIGTPAQKFVIDFDTGSSDLWAPSSSCTPEVCKVKHRYSASLSSTSLEKSGTFEIQYGDDSTVSGPIYTDTVTNLSTEFQYDRADGILGFAWPAISNLRQSPFFNTAIAQGAVSSGTFAFNLAASGSELFLGGTDTSKYSGGIEFHDINIFTGFWQAKGAKATVGSRNVVDNFETIIDSGTTIMYGPPLAVKAFYEAIPGSAVYDHHELEGLYSFPCNSTPTVGFNWGGKTWTISPKNFNLGIVGVNRCVGTLAAQDIGLGSRVWLLGDAFMKNVYTVFSFDKRAVGFATLK